MSKPSAVERALTVNEAATKLGLSTRTIFRMIENKELPAYKVRERFWRIRESDVDRQLKAHEQEPVTA